MTKDELIVFGEKIWASMKDGGPSLGTSAMVEIFLQPEQDRQALFKQFAALAESGFPAAFKAEPREVTRYGRKMVQRQWKWQRALGSDLGAWIKGVPEKPMSGSTATFMADLETRLAAAEAEIKLLKAARD